MCETNLIIQSDLVQMNQLCELNKAYRFMPKDACLNFINGNIWFVGMNYNRLYNNDPNEYCFANHSSILTYSLSLSLSSAEKSSFKGHECIEIINLKEFVLLIKRALEDNTRHHIVSWIDRKEFIETAKKKKIEKYFSSVEYIKIDYPPCKPIEMCINAITIRKIEYYNSEDRVVPLSAEERTRAWNKNREYEVEEELRIELSGSNFFSRNQEIEPNFHHMVKYLKLKCDSLKDVCRIMY